ncbi:NUDIX domain-containing protein [Kitasatospora sp. NPDC001574]
MDIAPVEHPRRRLGCVVLLTREDGAVLAVETTYRPDLILPGGGAEQGERAAVAAARELREEIGLVRELSHVVALDQMPATERAIEGLNLVFDGGALSMEEAAALSIPVTARDEIRALVWVAPSDFDRVFAPFHAGRVRRALHARARGNELSMLFNGQPAPSGGA